MPTPRLAEGGEEPMGDIWSTRNGEMVVPDSTQYVAWEAGANRLTVKSWRGVWKWHTWRGDGPACIASGLAGTMQAAIAAAEEASE